MVIVFVFNQVQQHTSTAQALYFIFAHTEHLYYTHYTTTAVAATALTDYALKATAPTTTTIIAIL